MQKNWGLYVDFVYKNKVKKRIDLMKFELSSQTAGV